MLFQYLSTAYIKLILTEIFHTSCLDIFNFLSKYTPCVHFFRFYRNVVFLLPPREGGWVFKVSQQAVISSSSKMWLQSLQGFTAPYNFTLRSSNSIVLLAWSPAMLCILFTKPITLVPLSTSNLIHKNCSLKTVLVISELFKHYCQSEVIFDINFNMVLSVTQKIFLMRPYMLMCPLQIISGHWTPIDQLLVLWTDTLSTNLQCWKSLNLP